MKYQTILFDMDGTILDTLEDLQSSVNHMREKYGYPPCSLDEGRRFILSPRSCPTARAC